jgi:D-aminoacyl-tRNA deacylase
VRLLLQRVTRAEVRVADQVVGSIASGLVAFVGVANSDTPTTAQAMARKCVELRIFRDEAGLTNRSLLDVGGELLAISQFTLLADTSRGRRPSFINAAPAELGKQVYERFAAAVEERGVIVARGVFGAEMAVDLVNDGPFTIWLDSAAP